MLLKVTPQQLDDIWPKASEWLAKAIEMDGLITNESVYKTLESGYNQLWVCETAAAVTSIEEYPKGRVCFIWLAGGSDLSNFKKSLPLIEQWAAEMGCCKMRVGGRAGWRRLLGDYHEPHITLEKQLCPFVEASKPDNRPRWSTKTPGGRSKNT